MVRSVEGWGLPDGHQWDFLMATGSGLAGGVRDLAGTSARCPLRLWAVGIYPRRAWATARARRPTAGLLRDPQQRGLGAPAAGAGRWRPGPVGGAARGVPDHGPPALLEPQGAPTCWTSCPGASRLRLPTRRQLVGGHQGRGGTGAGHHGGLAAGTRSDQCRGQLLRDWVPRVAFYDFHAEHWRRLRTSNVVESISPECGCAPT